MHVDLFLFLTGGIILLGFLGRLLFEKTHFPDVLLLMGFGMVLGRFVPMDARQLIYQFAPFFGTLALVMILFEGGLEIKPQGALAELRPALLLSSFTFVLTTAVLTAIAYFVLGWNLLPSTLLGTALGCTSSAIAIPVAQRVTMPGKTRTLINLEAAFSDTFAIVVLLSLLEVSVAGHLSATAGIKHLLGSFGIAAGVAVLVSVLWMMVLEYTKDRPLSYLLTFAVLLLLYAFVEALKGSGAIAVFIFGIFLTEAKELPSWLFFVKKRFSWSREEAHEVVEWFHRELTFLVRTFFFVYIGLLFEAERLSPLLVTVSVLLTVAILIGRVAGVRILKPAIAGHSMPLLSLFMPRGLVSVVLAGLPAARGVLGTERFLDYVVPVVILTNLAMAVGLFFRGIVRGKAHLV